MGACTSKPKTNEYDGVMDPLIKGDDLGRENMDTGRQIAASSDNDVQFFNSTSKNSERSLQILFTQDIPLDSEKPKKQTDDDVMNRDIKQPESLQDKNIIILQDVQLDSEKTKKQTDDDDDAMNRDTKQAESLQEHWSQDDPSQLKPEKDQDKEEAVSSDVTRILFEEAKAKVLMTAETLESESKTDYSEEQRTQADSPKIKDREKQQIEGRASSNTLAPEGTAVPSEEAKNITIAEVEPLLAYEEVATETEVLYFEQQETKGKSSQLMAEDQSKSSVAVEDLLLGTVKYLSPEAKVADADETRSQKSGKAEAADAVSEEKGTAEALELQASERDESNNTDRKAEQKQEPVEEVEVGMLQTELQESHETLLDENILLPEVALGVSQSYQGTTKEAVYADDLACLSQQTSCSDKFAGVKEADAEVGDLEDSTHSRQFVSQGVTGVCDVLEEVKTACVTLMKEDKDEPMEAKEEEDLPDDKFVECSDVLSAICVTQGGGLQELSLSMPTSTLALDEQLQDVKSTQDMQERIEEASNIYPEGQLVEYGNNQPSVQNFECHSCVESAEQAMLSTSMKSENAIEEASNIYPEGQIVEDGNYQPSGQNFECDSCVESAEQAMVATSMESKNAMLEDIKLEAIAEANADQSITEKATEMPSETKMEVHDLVSKETPSRKDLEGNVAVDEYTLSQMNARVQPGMNPGNVPEIAGSSFAIELEKEDTPSKAISLVDLSKEDKTEMQEVLDSHVITEAPLGSGNLYQGHAGEEFLSAELGKGMADTGAILEVESQPCGLVKDIAVMICNDKDEISDTAIPSNDVSECEACAFSAQSSNSCELMVQPTSIGRGIVSNELDASLGVVELAGLSFSTLPEEFGNNGGKQLQENSDLVIQTLETNQSECQLESVPEGMERMQSLEVPSIVTTSATELTEVDSEHMPNLEEPHIQEMTQLLWPVCALGSQDIEQVIRNGDGVFSGETAFLSESSKLVSQGQCADMIPENEMTGIADELTHRETGLVTQFVETDPVLQNIDDNKIEEYLAESVQELSVGSTNTEEIKNIHQVKLSQGEVESEKFTSTPAENVQEIQVSQKVHNTVKDALHSDIPSDIVQDLSEPSLEGSRIEQGVVNNVLYTVENPEGKTEADLLAKKYENEQQSGEGVSVLLKADTSTAGSEGFQLDTNESEFCIEGTELSLLEKGDSTENMSSILVLEVENKVLPANLDQILERKAFEFERQASAEICDRVAAAIEPALQEPMEAKEH